MALAAPSLVVAMVLATVILQGSSFLETLHALSILTRVSLRIMLQGRNDLEWVHLFDFLRCTASSSLGIVVGMRVGTSPLAGTAGCIDSFLKAGGIVAHCVGVCLGLRLWCVLNVSAFGFVSMLARGESHKHQKARATWNSSWNRTS